MVSRHNSFSIGKVILFWIRHSITVPSMLIFYWSVHGRRFVVRWGSSLVAIKWWQTISHWVPSVGIWMAVRIFGWDITSVGLWPYHGHFTVICCIGWFHAPGVWTVVGWSVLRWWHTPRPNRLSARYWRQPIHHASITHGWRWNVLHWTGIRRLLRRRMSSWRFFRSWR